MKRYIRAMGMDRSSAKLHVESYKKLVADHIIECVVYRDSLDCYEHWITELTAWFDDINTTQLKIKRNPPKFKDFEYQEYVFGLLGTTTTDAKNALMSYKANNTEYPDFEITRSLVLELYGTVGDIEDYFCNLFARSKGHIDTTIDNIREQLHVIFDAE